MMVSDDESLIAEIFDDEDLTSSSRKLYDIAIQAHLDKEGFKTFEVLMSIGENEDQDALQPASDRRDNEALREEDHLIGGVE